MIISLCPGEIRAESLVDTVFLLPYIANVWYQVLTPLCKENLWSLKAPQKREVQHP